MLICQVAWNIGSLEAPLKGCEQSNGEMKRPSPAPMKVANDRLLDLASSSRAWTNSCNGRTANLTTSDLSSSFVIPPDGLNCHPSMPTILFGYPAIVEHHRSAMQGTPMLAHVLPGAATPSDSNFQSVDHISMHTVTSHGAPLMESLRNIFIQLQARSTKSLLRCWIKAIDPDKRYTHPYNQGQSSIPNYWPADVDHRDPNGLKHEGKSFQATQRISFRTDKS